MQYGLIDVRKVANFEGSCLLTTFNFKRKRKHVGPSGDISSQWHYNLNRVGYCGFRIMQYGLLDVRKVAIEL